ncbi:putative uncharacterized protein FLJ46214 [Numida meleagris]|uniref:putative uncharacterized protein FLJ46214 n=1 Tax=Numida meleagris TaxID=8996 RepID=UPI000B3D8C78|nr:putative uncharacterized protein FLJ46214 [Numida meleagris]
MGWGWGGISFYLFSSRGVRVWEWALAGGRARWEEQLLCLRPELTLLTAATFLGLSEVVPCAEGPRSAAPLNSAPRPARPDRTENGSAAPRPHTKAYAAARPVRNFPCPAANNGRPPLPPDSAFRAAPPQSLRPASSGRERPPAAEGPGVGGRRGAGRPRCAPSNLGRPVTAMLGSAPRLPRGWAPGAGRSAQGTGGAEPREQRTSRPAGAGREEKRKRGRSSPRRPASGRPPAPSCPVPALAPHGPSREGNKNTAPRIHFCPGTSSCPERRTSRKVSPKLPDSTK